jgi:RNA polymerase sporulation-specific sigma factor
MVRRIAHTLFLPGGDRDDLAQEARVGVIDAARTWDPHRGVPFSCFARLCAIREARMAVSSACSHKHQVLSRAWPLEPSVGRDDPSDLDREYLVPEVARVVGRRDDDPVAVTIAREQLDGVIGRMQSLTAMEREALVLAASDYTHREIADALQVRVRAVNNALQRARHKLGDAVAA